VRKRQKKAVDDPDARETSTSAGDDKGVTSPKRRWRGRVVFWAVLGVIGLLFLNELALRVAIHFRNERSLDRFINTLPPIKKGQVVSFGAIVQPSRHKRLIYQLRPNMDVTHKGVRVRTNSMGWRDAEYPVARQPGTVRIVGIGNSNMFGWGVDQDKNFLAGLERYLNKKYPQKRWEVINTAVPGYNTFMKVESLRTRALKYHPDMVILQQTVNDLLLPEFVYEYPDPWSLRRCYLYDLLMGRYKMKGGDVKIVFETDFKEVPREYSFMEGVEGFARSMVSLRDMKRDYGFEVVILISHDHPMGLANALMKLSKKMGFHSFIKMHRTDDPKLIVSKSDLHPSALGHKIILDALIKYLEKEGLIQKLAAKK